MEKKVAIVADMVLRFGGAEKVLEVFLEMFPEADLYSLFMVPSAAREIKIKFPKINIQVSPFARLIKGDRVSKYISIIKLFSWIYWERLDLGKYDLIISSSHSFMSKNVKIRKGAFHLSYIHTPPRFLYDEYCEVGFVRRFPWSWLFWPWRQFLRWIDKRGAERPNILAANSENVRKRIKKYYGKESTVIYPPVTWGVVKSTPKRRNYYVCLSRLVKQKGIDLAVKTCSKYNLPLVVLGNGDEYQNLKIIAGKSVKFISQINDCEKNQILAGAKALIYTSHEEDFGIVPVEALGLGIPVIAYNSGGVKETIKDGVNGVLFDDFNEESLNGAIKRLESININSDDCRRSTGLFGKEIFKEKIRRLIENNS